MALSGNDYAHARRRGSITRRLFGMAGFAPDQWAGPAFGTSWTITVSSRRTAAFEMNRSY
jgi:hypothetical protein